MSSPIGSDPIGVDGGGKEAVRIDLPGGFYIDVEGSIGAVGALRDPNGLLLLPLGRDVVDAFRAYAEAAGSVSPDAFAFDGVTAEGVATSPASLDGRRSIDHREAEHEGREAGASSAQRFREALASAKASLADAKRVGASPPLDPARLPSLAEMIERADFAIEGEFDGLAATPAQAREVVEFILTGMAPGPDRDTAIASLQRRAGEKGGDTAAINALSKGCSLTCESGGGRLPRVVVTFGSLPDAQAADAALADALSGRLSVSSQSRE